MVYGPNCSTKVSEDSRKKFNVLLRLWQTGKQFRNRQTGIRRGQTKFLVRDGRLGRIIRRQTKQGSRESGTGEVGTGKTGRRTLARLAWQRTIWQRSECGAGDYMLG